MRYFIAREQDALPYVVFDLIAETYDELVKKGLEASALVVEEERLLDPLHPEYIDYSYGMCSVRVQNGLLVPADKTAAIARYNKSLQVAKTHKAERAIVYDTFTFDGVEFPMTEGAMRYYDALASLGFTGEVTVYGLGGNYTLSDSKLESFKDAYYSKVIAIYSAQGVE